MPLPHTFISGNVARASEVNANFQYLMTLIGQASTPGRIEPTGEFIMGPRKTALLSAAHDTGPEAYRFYQISWNADWNKVGTAWKFVRILSNIGGSALRIGEAQVSVYLTPAKTGDMNSQMKKVWSLGTDTGNNFMFLDDSYHIQNRASAPTNIQHYRLTTVLLENPVPIYANTSVGLGTTIRNASNYGIPSYAQAIIIRAHVTAANNSGAGMHFYQQRGPGPTALNMFRGFVAHAPITGTGMGMRAGAQGIVPLGRGAQAGGFVIHRTAPFELANVHIIGYMT